MGYGKISGKGLTALIFLYQKEMHAYENFFESFRKEYILNMK